MGLYELFFPEISDSESLSRVARRIKRKAGKPKKTDPPKQDEGIYSELEDLDNDVGTLALILASVLITLDEKGQITREELKEKLKELDVLDGIRDGKIDVKLLRDSSFFK